mmetsp:Transcript_88471/g.245721  ORF Transcript_88471/g.245721 Transcript_88471/m.245721 type:complete len:222 (-) Transcript_88471:14-679(-)
MLLAREDILLKSRFDKASVLRQDAFHVPSSLHGVAPNAPGQTHVVVGVYKDPHVATVKDLGDVQRKDAFNDYDVCWRHVPGHIRLPLASDKVINWDLYAFTSPQSIEASGHRLDVEGRGLVKIDFGNVCAFLGSEVAVKFVQAQEHHALIAQGLRDALTDRGLATRSAASDGDNEGRPRENALRAVGGRLHGNVCQLECRTVLHGCPAADHLSPTPPRPCL